MIFKVLPPRSSIPAGVDTLFLVSDQWDDFSFKTQFFLVYRDLDGLKHEIGTVKIAHRNMVEDGGATKLDESFERLGDQFFSLGQDTEYYENIGEVFVQSREAILRALRDVAYDLQLFRRVRRKPVTVTSLLRFVSPTTVENQFHRLATGGARLSAFSFKYTYPRRLATKGVRPELSFEVKPFEQPPTNVHVIIGRNGVGKSLLLNSIATTLVQPRTRNRGTVQFTSADIDLAAPRASRPTYSEFANVLSVAFSAFDDFTPISRGIQDDAPGTLYTYIGLKEAASSSADRLGANLKGSKALAREFGMSVQNCLAAGKLRLWREALGMLESDPIFADSQVAAIASGQSDNNEDITSESQDLYSTLSSGHKIVLLTVTRLVEAIQERSLVLIDEPESHLHPPLLSAFIRALSNLLIDRNGVAIIATHSPVVLQEVPRSCVWMLRRSGTHVSGARPQLETFGENVGVLTHEVFGLEVAHSGFHRLLMEAVEEGDDYDEAMSLFGSQIGSEGRALLQAEAATHTQES